MSIFYLKGTIARPNGRTVLARIVDADSAHTATQTALSDIADELDGDVPEISVQVGPYEKTVEIAV